MTDPLVEPVETEPVEIARRSAEAMLANDAASKGLGMELEHVAPGESQVSMVVRADMLNGHGFAHGGMIFALADSAFAYVCNGANHASVAAQASIVFLDKVQEGETLIAEASEVARAGRAGVTRVAVSAGDGRKVAEFTGYSRTLGGPVVEV